VSVALVEQTRYVGHRAPMGWIATALVGTWVATSLCRGVLGLIATTSEDTALSAVGRSEWDTWESPVPFVLSAVADILWITSFLLLLPAAVLGCVCLKPTLPGSLLKSMTYVGTLVAGVAGTIWANALAFGALPSTFPVGLFTDHRRIGYGLLCVTALVVLAGVLVLLRPRGRTRPALPAVSPAD
jgi:hypothetical protein